MIMIMKPVNNGLMIGIGGSISMSFASLYPQFYSDCGRGLADQVTSISAEEIRCMSLD